jgi:HEAT repeat protein
MRAMAAFALAELADPAAHEAMLDALGDPAWQVRVEAVHYLGAMRLPSDRDVLLGMRADRHVVVRDAATEATR